MEQMVYDAGRNQWRKAGEPEPDNSDPLTKCPKCGEQSVQYKQEAWGDKWDCTRPGCTYSHYYSLGD
jgi:hypothetical protein